MTRAEFFTLAKGMKAVYADLKFLPDKDSLEVWYGLLQDLPYDKASLAVRAHMCSNRFPPTIADIRAKAAEATADVGNTDKGTLEAWALVYKAICNSSYNAAEEFAKLPILCQKAVGSPNNLKEWSLMDIDTVQSVEQSHFIRAYSALLAEKKDSRGIIPADRERLGMGYESMADRIEADSSESKHKDLQGRGRKWSAKAETLFSNLSEEFNWE